MYALNAVKAFMIINRALLLVFGVAACCAFSVFLSIRVRAAVRAAPDMLV